jgi:hypothetical protein
MLETYPVEKTQTEEDPDEEKNPNKRERLFGNDSNDPVLIALRCKDKSEKNKAFRKAFESVVHNIDRMGRKDQLYYQEMMAKMVTQDIRNDELLKLADALKEIDYSEADQLLTLFDYHN